MQMMRQMKWLAGLLFAAALVACGGGGGSSGATTSGGGTGTGGSGTATGTPTVTVSIVDSASRAVTSISVGGAYSARALVKDAAGAAVPNKLVTFALNGASIATLNPTTALTDSSGVAQTGIAPASINSAGAATLSASATVGTAAVTGQIDFSVSTASVALSSFTVGSANLASGGNTSMSVTVLIGGTPASGTPVNVTFNTSCGRINGGTTTFGTTTNGSGVASATYTAVSSTGDLCTGPVTLTAAVAGATPVTSTVTVAAPVANAITFVSATPAQIFVAGSGALEQSLVKFKVLAGTTPLANMAVRFSIVVNPGGVGLNASGSTADVTATSDANGEVTVSVFSGTIPGPVKVRATLVSNTAVFAETQNLTVASGPPSQRFMSLSVSTFNIEGWSRDGTPTTLTVRIADRQGNPVEDGTVVNFTAEGGQVAPSCATTRTGGISSCAVDFISQNPRPAGGRVSVLAFMAGTKDYVDVNGNNRYDPGVDTLVPIGDAFRDDDEDSVFDQGEFVVPRGGTVSCPGATWPFPSRMNTCDTELATTVRQQAVILFSSTTPVLLNLTRSVTLITFNLASAENQLLPMPSGTTVSAEAGDATPAEATGTCAIDKVLPSTVPNISPSPNPGESLATGHSITLKNCAAGDIISIKIRTPSGLETPFVLTL